MHSIRTLVVCALLCGVFSGICAAGEPITNNAEWIDKSAGVIRVYGGNKFALGADNVYRDIDLVRVEGKTLGGVSYTAKTRLAKPVLFRNGALGVSKTNCLVITGDGPDGDKHRLEISLGAVKFGGVEQTINLSQPDTTDPNLTDMGGIKVLTTDSRSTILVPGTDAIKAFSIVMDINSVGLKYEPHPEAGVFWFTYPNGRFFAELSRPELLDTKTLEPIAKAGPVMDLPLDAVGHSMQDLGGGRFRYTKFSKDGFDKIALPKAFYIDAQIAAETSDGWVYHGAANWDLTREDATGATFNSTQTKNTESIYSVLDGTTFCTRQYMWFDMSGVSGTVTGATVGIYGYSKNDEDYVMIMKSTAEEPLDASDYLAFADLDSGTWGSLTPAAWNASGYNVFTVNSTGISDIQGSLGGTICVCLRQDTFDYQDSTPTTNNRSGMYYADQAGTDYDPYIDITVSTFIQTIIVAD